MLWDAKVQQVQVFGQRLYEYTRPAEYIEAQRDQQTLYVLQ